MANNNFNHDIVRALTSDPRFEFKQRGQYLQQGICPNCGKRELFISVNNPGVVQCNRLNNCGYSESTRDIYPEIFNSFSERFPKTKQDPNATANAYMAQNRGFPLKVVKGWYEQGSYRLPNSNTWVDTVKIYIDENKERYWQRLIDKTKADGQKNDFGGKRKSFAKNDPLYNDFNGSLVKGEWWEPPGQEIEDNDEVFIVEGIFHAIALHLVGAKAVATFMAANFPTLSMKPHLGKKVRWILALDDDKAGRTAMTRHINKLKKLEENYGAALTGTQQDWDDIYRLGKLDNNFIDDCIYRGNLFTATSIKSKAFYWYRKHRWLHTVMSFNRNLYSISIDDQITKAMNEADVDADMPDSQIEDAMKAFIANTRAINICNCEPDFRYIQVNALTNERKYFFNLAFPEQQRDSQLETLGSALESAANFRKSMLSLSDGGNFTGNAKDFTLMTNRWLNGYNVSKVDSFDFIGYVREFDAYVFNDFAYQGGKKYSINKDGFFKLKNASLKTNLKSVQFTNPSEYNSEWFSDFITAFGMNGLFSLVYWYASLFAEQIRAKLSGFPFLELSGDHGTGKTTLLKFLWKLVGREGYEGFDLNKASMVGRRRALSQLANLPLVVIESDRSQGAKSAKHAEVNYDDFKSLYDGGEMHITGVKSASADTNNMQFRGSLVFAQNVSPDGSDAFLSRVVHCHFDKSNHTEAGKDSATRLKMIEVEKVNGFIAHALKNEAKFLECFFECFPKVEAALSNIKEISDQRVVLNHAMILSCAKALQQIMPELTDQLFLELTNFTKERAVERSKRIGNDHPIVDQFWRDFDFINQPNNQAGQYTKIEEPLNHSADETLIAINLEEVHQELRRRMVETASKMELKKLLKQSISRKFIGIRSVRSRARTDEDKKSVWCWIFKREES